jgi:hypothetical protein
MANKPRLVRGIISELNVYGADTPVIIEINPELDTNSTVHITFEKGFLLQKPDGQYVYDGKEIVSFLEDGDIEAMHELADIHEAKPKSCVIVCL